MVRNTIVKILILSGCFLITQRSQGKGIQSSVHSDILNGQREKIMTPDQSVHDTSTVWINAKDFEIDGMGWKNGIEDYTRLPNKYETVVSPKVWRLSRDAAGISVRFTVKGTSFISARWMLRRISNMSHMTPLAINGLDLYIRLNGKWVWAGVGKPGKTGEEQKAVLKSRLDVTKTYECLVYLPLYNGISSLKMGFSSSAIIKTTSPTTKKPFVFYGTSILQGCSASRTGMVFSSMLGRRFETPVINLGFSGNGLMEEYFGEIMGEIDASVYFIDCLPNMSRFSTQEITDRTLAIVRKLRARKPNTPIVLVEDRTPAYENFTEGSKTNNRRAGMKAACEILVNETVGLYYVEGEPVAWRRF